MEELVNIFTLRFGITILFVLIFLPTTFSCKTDVTELTVRVKSRMYQDFQEDHKVEMFKKFPISDTDLEGVVVEFLPDFAIDTLTHKAFSRSDTLKNPAVKILLIHGRNKKDEVWAFSPGLIPHFSPKSFIGFELLDIKVGGKYKRLPVSGHKKENE